MEDLITRCSFAWTTRCLTYVRVVKRSCIPTSWIRHNRLASSMRGSQRADSLSLAVAPRVDRFPVAYLDNLVQALSDNAIPLRDDRFIRRLTAASTPEPMPPVQPSQAQRKLRRL